MTLLRRYKAVHPTDVVTYEGARCLFLAAYMTASDAMGHDHSISFWERVSSHRFSSKELMMMKTLFHLDGGSLALDPSRFDMFKLYLEANY